MTKMTRGLWLTAAASIAFAMGCGGGGGDTDAGSGCTTDSACGTGKVCHPVLKSCVASCTGSVDCPASAKTCARMDGTAGTTAAPGFCQCTTDAICASGTANQVCNQATKQCSDKCTSNLSCPTGSTCNATTGVCGATVATDSGTGDAGTMTDAGVACSLNNPQPDTCGYANACGASMTCQDAVNDSACANITAAITAGNYTAWNPATSTGPVIYTHSDDSDVAAGCTGATDVAFTTTIYAYAGANYTFPATIGAATQLSYYRSNGTRVAVNNNLVGSATNAWSHYIISNSGKNVEIKLTLCAPQGTTSLTAGFAFSNGNAYCADLTRN